MVMIHSRRSVRSTRGRELPHHIIESEEGFEELTDFDFYIPDFEEVKNKLKDSDCEKCDGRTTLEFGSMSCLVQQCTKCDYKRYACPVCATNRAKQQTIVSHFEKEHSNLVYCPFCSELLSSAVGDRVRHLVSHVSSTIYSSDRVSSTGENNGQSELVINDFPSNLGNNQNDRYNPRSENPSNEEPPTLISTRNQSLQNQDNEDMDEHYMYGESGSIEDEESDGEEEEDFLKEGDDDEKLLLNERRLSHINRIFEEFVFIEKSTENYDLVIKPINPKDKDDYGVFYSKENLNLIRYARKNHLSEEALKELIYDLQYVYKSPFDFYNADSLNEKLHSLAKNEGIRFKEMKCAKNHLVCIVPLEEGLKLVFSKEEFLNEFHVQEWVISDDEPFMHYRQGEKFIKESIRAREEFRCHYISIHANRDSFPAYLSATLPLKGYYCSIGNVDYPECERHVFLFAFGMECTGCCGVVEREFVDNINLLSQNTFLIYHRILEKYVRFRTEFDAEIDDTPQVSENVMSKSHNGRLFCRQCGQHDSRRIDPFSVHECKRKTLLETETLYFECKNLLLNSRSGDGAISKVNSIEDKSGRTFTTSTYSKEKRHNVTILKKPTSFFRLNYYTKKNLINPPGPFHSIIKGFVLHVKDGMKEKLGMDQKLRILERWKSIDFPKGTKKPGDVWGIGGNNFDAILSLVYALPISIDTVLPQRFVNALYSCFRSIITLITPGFSRKQLMKDRISFFNTIPVICTEIDIDFPTTHNVFHVWDRVVPPTELELSSARLSIPQDLPAPPEGPILLSPGEQNEKIISLGPSRIWSEKKYEVKHKRHKKKMKKCFLRNASVYLVKEYVADETFSLFYPERKWLWFSTLIRYSLLKDSFFSEIEKTEIMDFLILSSVWKMEEIEFLAIKELKVRTKVFRRSHKIVCGNYVGVIKNLIHVSWGDGFGLERSSIVIILEEIDSKEILLFEAESVKGKPVMLEGLKNIIM